MDTGGTVVGDPPEVYVPRTPRRRNRRSWQAGDQNDRGGNNAKRRTLFFSAGRRLPVSPDSDLSDISPLSKTSGSEGDQLSDTGRPTALPWSPNRTPLKCISPLKNNFDQLLIGKSSPSTPHVSPSPFSSPLADRRRSIQASRPGRSPRLKGISPLGPDRGVIEPVKFYGNKEETPLNGVQLLRKIRASLPSSLGSVRARLFLDDHPRDRKRARSGGAAAGPAYAVRRPPSKRQKRHHHSSGAVIKERPRLLLDHETAGRRFSDPPKRKTTPEGPKLPAKSPKSEFGGLKKRVCNWEVFSFSRPPRVRPREDEEGAGTFGPRKFFKTVVDKTPKRPCDDTTEGVLTPPPTVRKSRKLLSKSDWFDGFTQLDDLPETDSDVGGERSQEDDDSSKRIVEEIREDVLEMMVEDNGDEEVRNEVEELLKSWDDGSEEEGATGGDAAPDTQEDGPTRVNDVYSKKTEMAKPAPENKKSDDVGSKFFPIFSTSLSLAMSPNGKKKQLDKKSKLGWGEDQLQIDAGQNGLREVQCATCGLLYAAGNPEDEQQHEAYHNKYAELRYTGWKKERLAGVHGLERIVYITRDDPKTWWTKAKTVAAIVDADLGFPEVTLEAANNPKVFLYIKDKRICGCAIAEVVRQAHRLLDLPPVEGVTEVDVCSEEAYPVRCGISRLWVHPHHRRSGVATRLLDAIRRNFCFGNILRLDDMAFSVPTEAGKRFAHRYTGRKDFLVYM